MVDIIGTHTVILDWFPGSSNPWCVTLKKDGEVIKEQSFSTEHEAKYIYRKAVDFAEAQEAK